MEKTVKVKIFLRKNKYTVVFKSSHLNGEMICENAVKLDRGMQQITAAFPDVIFHVKFSQGALGRYTWEINSPVLLFKLGYKWLGYIRDTDVKLYYNDELREFVVIDEDKYLKKYKLN